MEIVDLVASVDLKSVRFLEASGTLASLLPEPPLESVANMEVNTLSWGKAIEVWVRMTVQIPEQAMLRVAVSTVYNRDDDVEVPDDVRRDFVARVAVMTAFPYIREGVQSMATRLAVDVPTLGLLKQGQVVLEAGATGAE